MSKNYDFSGWATKNDLLCSDGRTIRKNAFKANDGQVVPLVWNHKHNDIGEVLGHALLENRDEGVYAYCTLNDTTAGQNAKELVVHGDVTALSIYANNLKQKGGDVLHGAIREVSLVLAGANPGAYIDNIIAHSDDGDSEDASAIIYTGEDIKLAFAEELEHAEEANKEKQEDSKMADNKEKTVQDVLDELTEEQLNVVKALIGAAVEEATEEARKGSEGGNTDMKHNLFDAENEDQGSILSHSEMESIVNDAKRYGSMKDSAIAHGITDIEYLMPDATLMDQTPPFITRKMDWVAKVMAKVHKVPFSRIKSMFADLTEDDARAKGYIKGKLKKEQVFSLLKRTTTPTTIYKKQKLDRDDVVDITDFDVIAWIKSEMRFMLDEEIARAILVGDGRPASSDDKINEQNIRPIWTDDAALFTVVKQTAKAESSDSEKRAKAFIKNAIKARKEYRGSGRPDLWCGEDILTDCLLLEDGIGHRLYNDINALATTLRVGEIIPVPVMDGLSRTVAGNTYALDGIIANLADYAVGADKGGAVNMFDDFDIDYNAMKYLIETRCSGALTTPFSAIILEHDITADTQVNG